MNIEKLFLRCSGYVECESKFYSVHDTLSETYDYTFVKGLNLLTDDIDSGIWAASYVLSMFNEKRESFVLFDETTVVLNNLSANLDDVLKRSCYMDELYSLFSSKKTVKELLEDGVSTSKSLFTIDELKKVFCLSDDRCERPISQVGNERFRAMAAVGLAYDKQIFCFPWLSRKRFEYFNLNLTFAIDKLNELERLIILPVGN